MKSIKLKSLLKEAYGVQKATKAIEDFAKNNSLTFKKLNQVKKPGNYGGGTTYTFYQIGDKYIVTIYKQVPGAPRLNSVGVYIVDKPAIDAKGSGMPDVGADYEITDYLKKQSFGNAAEKSAATKWNKSKLDKFIKDLGADKAYNKFTDDQAWDMAQSILDDEEGLEDAIKREYRVSDVVGWLANRL